MARFRVYSCLLFEQFEGKLPYPSNVQFNFAKISIVAMIFSYILRLDSNWNCLKRMNDIVCELGYIQEVIGSNYS